MRIGSYKAFISKIRNTLANNKNSPYAKAAEEKEKKLTEELNYLQIDIERVIATKLTFGRIEEPEETKTHQVQQDDVTDDADLEFLLQQEFAFDSLDNQDHSFFDREESSNSEQSKSIEEVKSTPAAKKRILVNLELEGDDTPPKGRQLRSRKLKHDDNEELATAPNTRSRTANKGAQTNRNTVNNTNVMTVKQTKGQKRKRQEEVFVTSKKRKLQPAGSKKEVPNNSTSEEMNSLALRVEDTTCLFPLTISQVFLFNALAVALSLNLPKTRKCAQCITTRCLRWSLRHYHI